ncbi:uncharacterized protein LOC126341609 isoform X2 [Schistocerca gregaria]|uniref:uncharacterized protein LOC126341609 isoform X2 n=1 Tax=Schistocerca gregaria TaxID=7010 RepID=UPI00211E0A04|nr:uncharacterized protein LOC126341609 isoform X2 [Schistocerca gregaria]
MDKSDKFFVDSFVLGLACGFRKCLDVLSDYKAECNKDSSTEVPGGLRNLLKMSAEILNHFGNKVEDEANIQSSLFRSIFEAIAASSEKSLTAAVIDQQMSAVFEELAQAFTQLIRYCSEVKVRHLESCERSKPREKTSTVTDLSEELCQVLQEMEGILTQIVDAVKSNENSMNSSPLSRTSGQPSEKTDLTTGNSCSVTGEETFKKMFEDDSEDRTGSAVVVLADNNDDIIEGNDSVEEQNNQQEVEDKGDGEIGRDCDDTRSHVDQEEVESKTVVPLSEGGNFEQHACIEGTEEEDTEDEVTAAMDHDACSLTEDDEVTPEVSEEKELLELSTIRMFREHMDRDCVSIEIFKSPRSQPTKHPRYTCRLLEIEAAGSGRSKRTAKRNALCKMIHLLVRMNKEGCLPKEITPFTNEELWVMENVCLGGDDYLSQLRRMCDLENAPPPLFDVQISKDSLGDKTFTVKCTALGKSAVGESTLIDAISKAVATLILESIRGSVQRNGVLHGR